MHDANTDADKTSQASATDIDCPFESLAEFESELTQALKNDQFILHLQPKVDLSTWSIQGVEVLLRWKHPQQGIIPPAMFIPLLEQTGMIVDVGQWVLGEACELNRQWQVSGLPPVQIAINVSGTQLSRAGFAETVCGILDNTNLPAEFLALEFTENGLFTDTASNIKVCNQLRNKGIKLALDYSGKGYTSTEDISQLPIDIIKLDKELIHHIAHSQEHRAIMATILDFAHQNRLTVVAEGVETAEQLLFLNAMHCTSAQGFLLAHPMSVENFEKLYRAAPRYEYLIEKISHHW